jgi:tRNA G10  N-methylase Trm11
MAQYRYATENHNYEDYAAGRVLLNRPGATSFPVRLASEIFQQCAAALPDAAPYAVYDPCCGTGYLLTVLGLLHGDHIRSLTAADIDPDMTAVAAKNLALLSPAGMAERKAQLEHDRQAYGKPAHADALVSAHKLEKQLRPHMRIQVLTADATQPGEHLPQGVQMLITDVPYGRSKHWQGDGGITALLAAQKGALAVGGIAAIVTPKGETVQHPAYQRVRAFSIGKRQITLLRLASLS